MTESSVSVDLRLISRPHPHDPLVAVVDIPDGLIIDEHSVITDEEGHRYTYASGRDFERLASTAPFSQCRFFPFGRQLHVLPPDTSVLQLTL